MPRKDRIVIPDIPHHVTQRGNNKQPVFLDDHDRLTYIEILKERSLMYGLKIHGYCLMSNHVHWAVTPSNPFSLQNAIGYSHRLFAQKSNLRHNRTGHLWESRYFSCPLDEEYFLNVLAYIDQNPMKSGMVSNPFEYYWSSARAHISLYDPVGLIDIESWAEIANVYNWPEFIKLELKNDVVEKIESCLLSGAPCGKIKRPSVPTSRSSSTGSWYHQ
jgi:putative transposase